MARFQIARLLGAVLTISVMTGYMALPVMAAEEIAATAEASQEAGADIAGDTGEQGPEKETKEQTVKENADAESTNMSLNVTSRLLRTSRKHRLRNVRTRLQPAA